MNKLGKKLLKEYSNKDIWNDVYHYSFSKIKSTATTAAKRDIWFEINNTIWFNIFRDIRRNIK